MEENELGMESVGERMRERERERERERFRFRFRFRFNMSKENREFHNRTISGYNGMVKDRLRNTM